MILLALCVHVLFDASFGSTLLILRPNDRDWVETFFLSILSGMYVETLSVATLMFLGFPFWRAALGTALGMVFVVVIAFYRGGLHQPQIALKRLHWYEWAAMAAIGEKILFAVWQLTATPTYFQDALMHWSGRARSLYGQVNWSFDSTSPFFMGQFNGNANYPLLVVVWRALSAGMSGGWNDIVSRADGPIFFVIIIGTVWFAVERFLNVCWLPAAIAFTVAAVPLHVWHAAAGYSDTAVEAFSVAALAALLRKEWFCAGLMAAGAAWSKNDALVLYLPALVAAAICMQERAEKGRLTWWNAGWFSAGFATITPWLIFNYSHRLGIAPSSTQISYHADAPRLFLSALVNPTSGTLWIAVFAAAIYSAQAMFTDRIGQALILAFSISLVAIAFIFICTDGYEFLRDETTIYRTLMQFSGTALIVVAYGLSLKTAHLKRPKGL